MAARALVAPDSFKGTWTAAQVAETLAAGLAAADVEADRCPLADGGEGTLACLLSALGGELRVVEVSGPLGDPVPARFALLGAGGLAALEAAAASGHGLVGEGERDPERASTRGTGELIAAAARAGVQEVLVGVGGTASTDGGAGALEAIRRAGGIGTVRIVCLCDVRTAWGRAAAAFGPQKGADPAAVERLESRLERLAATLPRDPRGRPMAGAGGGLAGGLWAGLGAELLAGASRLCELTGFDARAARAGTVVTGEGRLDPTTAEGKVVAEVAARCGRLEIPAHAVVGADALGAAAAAELGLTSVRETPSLAELERAGEALGLSLG